MFNRYDQFAHLLISLQIFVIILCNCLYYAQCVYFFVLIAFYLQKGQMNSLYAFYVVIIILLIIINLTRIHLLFHKFQYYEDIFPCDLKF